MSVAEVLADCSGKGVLELMQASLLFPGWLTFQRYQEEVRERVDTERFGGIDSLAGL